MLRKQTVLALVAVFGLGMMTADTFGQCSKSKTTKVAEKSSACCGHSEFPTMAVMVGDKDFTCPMAAEKAAKESDAKVVYVVAGEKYACRESATKALADAAEDYVKKFTTIACVVDGKVIYCDDKSSCCSKAKGKTVSAGSTCCKSKTAAKVAKAGGCCSKSKTAKLVKDDGRSGDKETASCHKGDTAKVAKAEGCTGHSKATKLVLDDGRSDDKETVSCHKGDTAKVAKAEGCTGHSKTTKLVSDDGKTANCGKAEKAKLAKAAGCCSSKSKTAKVAKSDEGESCPLSKLAKLVSSCCKDAKDAKNVKYLVAGRTYDKREDAERARDAVVEAMKTVSMKYMVDGKEYTDSNQVCPMAMKAGKVKFVVNDVETDCNIMARVNLAKAQYDAAKGATVKLAKL